MWSAPWLVVELSGLLARGPRFANNITAPERWSRCKAAALLWSVIAGKKKIWILTPSVRYALFFFLGSSCKRVWLMVAVNIGFLPINRRKKGQRWFVCGRFACQRCLISLLIMVLVLWINSHYYPVCLKEVWTWPSLLNDKPYQRDEGSKEGKVNEGGWRKTQFILNNWLHLSKHSLLAQWSCETKSMPTAKKKKKKKVTEVHIFIILECHNNYFQEIHWLTNKFYFFLSSTLTSMISWAKIIRTGGNNGPKNTLTFDLWSTKHQSPRCYVTGYFYYYI